MSQEYNNRRLDELAWEKTIQIIPDGVMTKSKMPNKHVQPLYPLYIDRAEGAYLYSRNKKYIDYPCALGSVLLGYHYPEVDQAIIKQLTRGCIYSLPSKLETKLAEKIIELIPCAEMVQFLKTGSEATAAAVKIARAATGKEGIVCCGYHGWHDWYGITTDNKKGIPKSYSKLAGQVNYGDREMVTDMFSLSNMVEKEVAAIILEPYIYEGDKEFLEWVIEFAHNNEALVIFDEVVTGFRTKGFSAQKMFGVTPDLACFGKAMANGLPISVVCGKKQYMNELKSLTPKGNAKDFCFVSSTFGGDTLSIAAALATIAVLEREPVIDHIWDMGQKLIDGVKEFTADIKGADIKGYPCRTFFDLPTDAHKSLLWQECIKQNVLLGYAQFISYSHTDTEIYWTLDVLEEAFKVLKKYWDEPNLGLDKGVIPASATFRHRR